MGMQGRTLFGRPLGITLIVIQKSVWAVVLIALSVLLFWFRLQHVVQPFQAYFYGELAEDPHDVLANLLIHLIPHLSSRSELLLGVGAAIYATLEIVEAWGLWRLLLWVELLTVFETSAFLPYEIWEIFRQPSILKVLSFVINVLVVWYLVTRYLGKRAEHLAREAEQLARREAVQLKQNIEQAAESRGAVPK
jgi:uncharacterized membrane protein (DUF2068 family)